MKNPLEKIVEISTTHPGKTLTAFIIIAVLFAIPASQLAIDTSLEGAFGNDLPEEVENFEKFSQEFEEQELVTIVVDCSDSNASNARDYLDDLSDDLKESRWFTDIEYTQDMSFAGEKSILYVPQEQLNFLLDPNATRESVMGTYQYIMSEMNKPSYIVSENGDIYLLNMILNVTIDSADTRNEIFVDLESMLDDVQGSNSDYESLEVGYTGSMVVLDYQGDNMALGDMYMTLGVTFILIIILLFISFRSISLPLMALIPLALGILITAGMISILYGTLSMLSTVFAVLLLGLGIDFSIHMLSRFTEEMQVKNDIHQAFKSTSMNTGKAVMLGTFTTATAFGGLALSKIQGLHEMGIILALGLIITMACVFFVLPAVITLRLKKGKLKKKLSKRDTKFSVLKKVGKFSANHAVVVLVVLILVGSFFAYQAKDVELSSDMSALQPKTVPAYQQLEKVKENFNYTEDYILSMADSYDELVRTVNGFEEIPEVMEVESILDYIPKNQTEKLELFEQAKDINPELEDVSWLNMDRMTWQDLPSSIKENWVSNENGEHHFLIRVKAWGEVWNEEYRAELLSKMKEVNGNIVSRATMINALMDIMSEDVMKISLYVVVPIFAIVFIGFRKKNPVYALLALIPVIIGIGGILALSGPLDVDLNIVSVMMIPLVIGIGIDDGIHIIHRYKEEGDGAIPKTVQRTGKAIFLTTATTCLAFSSFTIAEHPGMRALGQVPVLGLVLCFIASIFFLTALIKLILDRK